MQLTGKIRSTTALWGMTLILLLATSLRLARLGFQSLAFDESWSLIVGLTEWTTLFQAVLSSGVHPPLFYILHKESLTLWGTSEFGQRFAAAIFGIIAIALIYRAGRVIFNRGVALLAALLLALNPIHIWFAQEARMYSLLGTLAIVSMTFFWQAIQTNRPRYWVMLTISNSLIFILHYFGLLIPTIQFIFIILTFSRNFRHLSTWTMVQAIAFIPLIPWLILVASREGQSFGIGFLVQPTLLDFPVTYWNLLAGSSNFLWPATVSVMALGLTSLLIALRPFPPHKTRPKQARLLVGLWMLLPPLIIWIVSQRRPFYADRYLTIAIPGLILLLAFGVMRISSSRWRTLLAIGLVAAVGYGFIATRFDAAFQKDDWRGATAYLAEQEQPDDIILLYSTHIKFIFDYYYPGNAPSEPISLNMEQFPIEPLIADYQRAWVIYPYTRRPTHYPMQPPKPEGFWAQDPDRNPFLEAWFAAQAADIIDYQHFPGIEIWLVDLSTTPRGQAAQ